MKFEVLALAWAALLLFPPPSAQGQSVYEPYIFITFAGQSLRSGSADGTGSAAQFNGPTGVAVDSAGMVYVADTSNHTIRKITQAGVVTMLAGHVGVAGSADGTGSAAHFSRPLGVAVDSSGTVYVAENGYSDPYFGVYVGGNTIRKITPAGVVTTLAGQPGVAGSADGTGSAAQFNQPQGVAVDSGGTVYVADTYNHAIRRITPVGVVTTLAGQAGVSGSADGTGSAARFNQPQGVAVDSAGAVYVADTGNNAIRQITPAGVVTTLAASTAWFHQPQGVAVDSAGTVYVVDSGNQTICKITPAGVVTTLAGLAGSQGSADGTGKAARFNNPSGVAVDRSGTVYVADVGNSAIRKGLPPVGAAAILVEPQGQAEAATYDATFTVVANGAPPLAYQWRKDGITITGATNASYTIPSAQASDGGLYTVVANNAYGSVISSNALLTLIAPYTFTTLAGHAGSQGSADGTGSAALFGIRFSGAPLGVAVDSAGMVYAADTGNNTIRKITPAGVVTTLAGLAGTLPGSADGAGSAARFFRPSGVAVDTSGTVYVADTGNDTIRKITPAGVVTTLAGNPTITNQDGYVVGGYADGTGSAARFAAPFAVAVDSAGTVYVAESGNYTIRKISPAGVVTTLAGQAGNWGYADGTGRAAQFGTDYFGAAYYGEPLGIAVDSAGTVYVADAGNNTIRKITPAGVVTTLAGEAAQYDANWNLVAGGPGSADGTGSAARFNSPIGVAVDSSGNVYVADTGNNSIRKITSAGVVTTVAGLAQWDADGNPVGGSADGTGSAARFGSPPDLNDLAVGPTGVAVDSSGTLYVADSGNHTIREGFPAVGAPVVLVQPGSQTAAATYEVTLTVEANGALPLTYQWHKDGAIIAGATNASYSIGSAQVSNGGAYTLVASNFLGSITSFDALLTVTAPFTFGTLAGQAGIRGSANGTGSTAQFAAPSAVAVDSSGTVYVADTGNGTIRKITSAGLVTTLAGQAGVAGSADGTGSAARFTEPSGVAVDTSGTLYVADTGNSTIRKITPAGVVTTLAGSAQSREDSADGTGSAARFNHPGGLAVDSFGMVYVADTRNSTIRQITPAGVVTTLAGQAGVWGSADGTGSAAQFLGPQGVAVDSSGTLYVTEYAAGDVDVLGNRIRKITPMGVVTKLAGLAGVSGSVDGTGSRALFSLPQGVAVDRSGNVYVADTYNNTIRQITSAGVVATVAGNATITDQFGRPAGGYADGTGSAARFNRPWGLAVDSAGSLYVADTGNNTIRKGWPALLIQNSGPAFGFSKGQFGFSLAGAPTGQGVVVEASTDLAHWQPIWTNTVGGILNFTDPQSGAFPKRFYRLARPQ